MTDSVNKLAYQDFKKYGRASNIVNLTYDDLKSSKILEYKTLANLCDAFFYDVWGNKNVQSIYSQIDTYFYREWSKYQFDIFDEYKTKFKEIVFFKINSEIKKLQDLAEENLSELSNRLSELRSNSEKYIFAAVVLMFLNYDWSTIKSQPDIDPLIYKSHILALGENTEPTRTKVHNIYQLAYDFVNVLRNANSETGRIFIEQTTLINKFINAASTPLMDVQNYNDTSSKHDNAHNYGFETVYDQTITDVLSYGPIAGLVDDGKSILINGTPILSISGLRNLPLQYDVRYGYPIQSPSMLYRFPAITKEINQPINNNSPIVIRADFYNSEFIDILLESDKLYAVDPQHPSTKIDGYFTPQIKYKFSDETDDNYRSLTQLDDSGFTIGQIQGNYETPHIYTYRLYPDFQGAGKKLGYNPIDIQISRTDPVTGNNPLKVKAIQGINGNISSLPSLAHVTLLFDSKQFNQIPKRQYILKGRLINIPSNYDPISRTYQGIWDGLFKKAWTDNPAWIIFDILTDPIVGAGRYIPINVVDKYSFYDVGQECDKILSNKGDIKAKHRLNVVLDTKLDLISTLSQLMRVIHANLIETSQGLKLIIDKKADPIYHFNNSNVINGEFNYSTSELKNRHHSIKVKYKNEDHNYNEEIIVITHDLNNDSSKYGGEKVVDAVGITDSHQAERFGRYLLASEHLETTRVQFQGGIECGVLEVGDVIEISDFVRIGINNNGRITRVVDNDQTLKCYLDLVDKHFLNNRSDIILVLNSDIGRISFNNCTIIQDDYGYYIEVPNSSQRKILANYTYCLYTDDITSLLYKIYSIEYNPNTYIYKIVAIQYSTLKYDYAENLDQSDFIKSNVINKLDENYRSNITNITAKYRVENLNSRYIDISWEEKNLSTNKFFGYDVFLRDKDTQVLYSQKTGINGTSTTLNVTPLFDVFKNYEIEIVPRINNLLVELNDFNHFLLDFKVNIDEFKPPRPIITDYDLTANLDNINCTFSFTLPNSPTNKYNSFIKAQLEIGDGKTWFKSENLELNIPYQETFNSNFTIKHKLQDPQFSEFIHNLDSTAIGYLPELKLRLTLTSINNFDHIISDNTPINFLSSYYGYNINHGLHLQPNIILSSVFYPQTISSELYLKQNHPEPYLTTNNNQTHFSINGQLQIKPTYVNSITTIINRGQFLYAQLVGANVSVQVQQLLSSLFTNYQMIKTIGINNQVLTVSELATDQATWLNLGNIINLNLLPSDPQNLGFNFNLVGSYDSDQTVTLNNDLVIDCYLGKYYLPFNHNSTLSFNKSMFNKSLVINTAVFNNSVVIIPTFDQSNDYEYVGGNNPITSLLPIKGYFEYKLIKVDESASNDNYLVNNSPVLALNELKQGIYRLEVKFPLDYWQSAVNSAEFEIKKNENYNYLNNYNFFQQLSLVSKKDLTGTMFTDSKTISYSLAYYLNSTDMVHSNLYDTRINDNDHSYLFRRSLYKHRLSYYEAFYLDGFNNPAEKTKAMGSWDKYNIQRAVLDLNDPDNDQPYVLVFKFPVLWYSFINIDFKLVLQQYLDQFLDPLVANVLVVSGAINKDLIPNCDYQKVLSQFIGQGYNISGQAFSNKMDFSNYYLVQTDVNTPENEFSYNLKPNLNLGSILANHQLQPLVSENTEKEHFIFIIIDHKDKTKAKAYTNLLMENLQVKTINYQINSVTNTVNTDEQGNFTINTSELSTPINNILDFKVISNTPGVWAYVVYDEHYQHTTATIKTVNVNQQPQTANVTYTIKGI